MRGKEDACTHGPRCSWLIPITVHLLSARAPTCKTSPANMSFKCKGFTLKLISQPQLWIIDSYMLSQLQFIFAAALDFFLMLFKDNIFVRPNHHGIQWHLKFHEWRLNWSTAPIYQVLWFCWHFVFVFSSMDCLHFLEPTDREYFITNEYYNTVHEDKNQRTNEANFIIFQQTTQKVLYLWNLHLQTLLLLRFAAL